MNTKAEKALANEILKYFEKVIFKVGYEPAYQSMSLWINEWLDYKGKPATIKDIEKENVFNVDEMVKHVLERSLDLFKDILKSEAITWAEEIVDRKVDDKSIATNAKDLINFFNKELHITYKDEIVHELMEVVREERKFEESIARKAVDRAIDANEEELEEAGFELVDEE